MPTCARVGSFFTSRSSRENKSMSQPFLASLFDTTERQPLSVSELIMPVNSDTLSGWRSVVSNSDARKGCDMDLFSRDDLLVKKLPTRAQVGIYYFNVYSTGPANDFPG